MYPNVYIIIAATMLAFWFKGVHSLLDIYSNDTFLRAIMLCLLPLIIFISDDGSLSELHNISSENDNLNSMYAAGMSTQ